MRILGTQDDMAKVAKPYTGGHAMVDFYPIVNDKTTYELSVEHVNHRNVHMDCKSKKVDQ